MNGEYYKFNNKGRHAHEKYKRNRDFFINLNEYVYATDIETNEIVYMNHKALEAYGLESIEDIKGLKCYEVLQKLLLNVECATTAGFCLEPLMNGVIIILY